ncbi:neuropeptide Y receptor type 1-like [Ptychodera flava]|uniref:neuropeptide Y receptor type 1-like n=1 Tax=Ptychodera flava TaxID=63121 RepID=UPI003969CEF8
MTATEDVPVAVLALLSIIAISGATSNILVCLVLTCTKKMRNATTLFILNLAVSDILYSSISIPLKLVSIANKHYWTLGNLGCKVVMFGPLFCITSSIYTMVAISHERRVDVMNGLHKKITLRQAKIAIVMIWILAVVSSAPQIYEYSTYKKVVLNSGSSQESESHSDEIPNSTAADGVESANLADLFAGGDEEADGRPRIVGGGLQKK